jgi:hypothetical protein
VRRNTAGDALMWYAVAAVGVATLLGAILLGWRGSRQAEVLSSSAPPPEERRADLARLGRGAGRSLGYGLIFFGTFVIAVVLLTGAVLLFAVAPLSLLPEAGDSAVLLLVLVYPASLLVAYRVTKRRFTYRPQPLTPAPLHAPPPDPSPPVIAPPAAPAPPDLTGATWGVGRATFPARIGPLWTLAATLPVPTGMTVLVGVCLILMLLLPMMPSGTEPPMALLLWFGLLGAGFGTWTGWVGWRCRQRHRRYGPPRFVVDADGLEVVAEGVSTRLAWADIAWVGARSGVPPARDRLMLVAELVPGVAPPPLGERVVLLRVLMRWYEPQPRFHRHLGLVRLFDLDLLDDPSAVAEAVDRYSGGRWRDLSRKPGADEKRP